MIARSRLLRPVLRLSAAEFPRIAAEQFGAGERIQGVWPRFAPIADTLVDSFWYAVDRPEPAGLFRWLEAHEPEVRGVAYEGAGMGLAMLDVLRPRRRRLASFIAGPGQPFGPLLLIGAGMALPRSHVNPLRMMAAQAEPDRWLVLDGYGFFHGFFNPERSLRRQTRPRQVSGAQAARVFDCGLGRSLWFTTAADVERIASTIGAFPPPRQGDFWAGVALGCAYAADVLDETGIRDLMRRSQPHDDQFAAGVATAALFRVRANCPAAHTDRACRAVWGMDASDIASIVAATQNPPSEPPMEPDHTSYESQRRAIAHAWATLPGTTRE